MMRKSIMKKLAIMGIVGVMAFAMTACGKSYATDVATKDVAEAICDSVDISEMTQMREDLVEDGYGADLSFLEEMYVLKSSEGVTPDEIAVFKVKEEGDLAACKEVFASRQSYQKENFESYKPDQVYKFDDVYVETFGVYAVMVIADDTADAKKAVEEVLK